MRVLMVTPSYFPIKGGAETVVRELSINLNRIGIPTDILTFDMNCKWRPSWQGKIESIDGIMVLKIPGFNWLPRAHSNRITQGINLIPGQFRKYFKNYDLIHFHIGDLTFPLFSAGLKVRRIAQFHTPLSNLPKSLIA